MKHLILLVLLLCFALYQPLAQRFEVDTLLYNGNLNRRVNLVILGDGYRAAEFGKLQTDARRFADALFREQPFARYQRYFNLFLIKVPSNQSGASHPGNATDVTEPAHPVSTVDNYFGSTFDYAGIHRLLVATRSSAITNVLAQNFPLYDQVFILVNSPYYGGSGGARPVSSMHSNANEIALHEMGHSFAFLADEYWVGDSYAREAANMTRTTAPGAVRWRNWLNTQQVGVYQHCCGGVSAQWYRPHQECKMRFLGRNFCAVCSEAIIERIHQLIQHAVEDIFPKEVMLNAPTAPMDFNLQLLTPEPNTLKVVWYLNGDALATNNTPAFRLRPSDLRPDINLLAASVEDTTQLVRVDNHGSLHRYVVTWTIRNNLTDLETIPSGGERLHLHVFPNPASDWLQVHLNSQYAKGAQLELYDETGRVLMVQKQATLREDQQQWTLNLQSLPAGVYSVKVCVNGVALATKVLKLE